MHLLDIISNFQDFRGPYNAITDMENRDCLDSQRWEIVLFNPDGTEKKRFDVSAAAEGLKQWLDAAIQYAWECEIVHNTDEDMRRWQLAEEQAMQQLPFLARQAYEQLRKILPTYIILTVDGVCPDGDSAILMCPDCADEFQNAGGDYLGFINSFEIVHDGQEMLIEPHNIEGLEDWFYEGWVQPDWTNEHWHEWWTRGLDFARQVKKLLPPDVSLFYFGISDRVWEVRPTDEKRGVWDDADFILIE